MHANGGSDDNLGLLRTTVDQVTLLRKARFRARHGLRGIQPVSELRIKLILMVSGRDIS